MAKKMVVGNWKMNMDFSSAEELLAEIAGLLEGKGNKAQVVVCPPFVFVEMALDLCRDEKEKEIYEIGAQNVSAFEKGAYTGEVSASMLAGMGVKYAIVGHSERRKYFGEDGAQLQMKLQQLLQVKIRPILCCGESLEEREQGIYKEVIRRQLEETVGNLNAQEMGKVVVAYEPVWAIGTGKTATPQQAEEVHAYIRSLLADKFGEKTASEVSLLYGGSCNAKTAPELFSQPNIDGGLIGGASLKAEEFVQIVNAAK